MDLERYNAKSDDGGFSFQFQSEGPRGTIKKIIEYQPVGNGVFNLAFGDLDEASGKLIDYSRSNNGDKDKILSTIASTVVDFLNQYPTAIVLAVGSTHAKTRLYQMAINKHYQQIHKKFDVMGYYQNEWESVIRGKNYEAFLVRLKN
jgi:hypothetical protein